MLRHLASRLSAAFAAPGVLCGVGAVASVPGRNCTGDGHRGRDCHAARDRGALHRALPLTIHHNPDAPDTGTCAIFLSGDGGWAKFSLTISKRLAARGFPATDPAAMRRVAFPGGHHLGKNHDGVARALLETLPGGAS